MNKIKLAICMKDQEYQSRFVNCFMNHYMNLYELHVFTQLEQLQKTTPLEYAVIITGDYTTDEMTNFVERGEILLCLSEYGNEGSCAVVENFICMEKYQEVYKIAEKIERLVADKTPNRYENSEKEYEMTGVYSLSEEGFQIPFAALLAKLYGEHQKVLLVDLQNYSGLGEYEEHSLGLEDLLSVVTTGNHSRGRLLECIRHEVNWDYVHPVQNNQCLAEGNGQLYEELIQLLTKELGYQRIILNLGTAFLGQLDLMERCRCIYMLSRKDISWREEAFSRELVRMDREELLQKMEHIEIPQTVIRGLGWRAVAEKWSLGTLTDTLQGRILKEVSNGAVV